MAGRCGAGMPKDTTAGKGKKPDTVKRPGDKKTAGKKK